MYSTFRITLADGQVFTQHAHANGALFGFDTISGPRLTDYEHEGDWLRLHFEGDYELHIPESRVAHIAHIPAA
jgi:hypothetical protein